MWTFEEPPLAYWKERYGFVPTDEWMQRLRQSTLRLPGCTGSIVSGNGLVMTNQHCARGGAAAVSPPDTDYVRAGFYAHDSTHEKRIPNYYVDQLISTENVTRQVEAAMTGKTDLERTEQREKATRAIVDECTAATKLVCQIVPLYNGGLLSLYRYKRYTDVRLVMIPEVDAAYFGGDPDNFTFPRYDLDVSFLRIYEDGRPLRTPTHLHFEPKGVNENEVVFLTGNPGSTGRQLTMAQLEHLRDVTYPAQLASLRRQLAVLRAESDKRADARRALQVQIYGLSNTEKAISGYLDGLRDSSLMAAKRAFERDFRARIAADSGLARRYGRAWTEVERAQRELRATDARSRWYVFNLSSLMNVAGGVVRVPRESARADSLRLAPYRGRGIESVRSLVLADTKFDLEVERRMLAANLAAALRELGPNDPYLLRILSGRTPEAAAETLFTATRLTDVAVRKELLEGGATAIDASTDPLVVLVRELDPIGRAEALRVERLNKIISANSARIGEALFAAYGTSLPPDATFTLRISDGVVRGYPMNGTIAPWKTVMGGMFVRAAEFDHQPPFAVPPRWKARRDRINPETPFNFVSTNDIIGGSSGSPVLNRAGDVVGVAFDGNIQMLPNRFAFRDEISRSVSVDVRAILEALRVVYDAQSLAAELTAR